MEKTLYERVGGFSTVSRIVFELYEQLLEDDELGPFFDDVDMRKLIDHQTKFVSSLTGGPASFTDKHLQMAHQHMDISDAHFDRLKEIVSGILADFSLGEDDIQTVLGAFEQRRSLLVKV